MSSKPSKKSFKKRITNADQRVDVVRKRLTEFYCSAIKSESQFSAHFHTSGLVYLGSGAFGHVFSITAKRDISFGDLEMMTVSLTRDEKHHALNRVEPLRFSKNSETAIKRDTSVALKLESAFLFSLEDFPVQHKCLPDGDPERFSLYKEYATLCALFNRFGYKETRGFTKPFAFGRLGDYSFVLFEGLTKTTQFGFHFMLLEMCGPNLEDMLEVCSHNCRQNDQRLSTRTVFLIGDQFISRLQCLQETSIGVSHNDLKCDQLMTGRFENTNTIYLIDYGMVVKFKETWSSTTPVPPLGNRRWAPRSNHQMAPRTPLCEIESACYVLLRLLKNHFPWDGMFDNQLLRLRELKDRGEDDPTHKTPDQVLYDEKQYLWFYLKMESGRKMVGMTDSMEQEIEKYKTFFEDRNDRWGDGGTQMQELMVDMAKLGDPLNCGFTEKKIDYTEMNYMGIRRHLLSLFDLSMYSHCVESASLSGAQRLQTEAFFQENRERGEQRTQCGRPVYHYFPEGEQHCFWEWHCRCRDFWEGRPEYWHKLLANREELVDMVRLRKYQPGLARGGTNVRHTTTEMGNVVMRPEM